MKHKCTSFLSALHFPQNTCVWPLHPFNLHLDWHFLLSWNGQCPCSKPSKRVVDAGDELGLAKRDAVELISAERRTAGASEFDTAESEAGERGVVPLNAAELVLAKRRAASAADATEFDECRPSERKELVRKTPGRGTVEVEAAALGSAKLEAAGSSDSFEN